LSAVVKAARKVGANVGFDLAHAAGNLPLQLHDWDVDFACWCGYKYLNGGPGGASGIFVHRKHGNNASLLRFGGWWGHDEATRFKMEPGFKPMLGADGWQHSNAPILSFAALLASLQIFQEANMTALRAKSQKLTGYLYDLLQPISDNGRRFQVITPGDPARRGAQISMLTDDKGKALFEYLSERGFIADWREPNVVRVAPTPLYNRFVDVFLFANAVAQFYQTEEAQHAQ
jgi:kynureninase